MPSSRHLLILLLTAAFALLPAFLLGAGGWDLHTHSLWNRLFDEQLYQGELYPRWLSDMFAGDGSPVFFYYPPLAYFITALFGFLQKLDEFGYYPMAASALLASGVAAVTCYVWLREETGDSWAALYASLLYVLAPANLTQNFYYLLLFSSVWAYAWLPLLMLYARRLSQGGSNAVIGYAVSLALLVMSNLPMTLIFGVMSVAYGICNINKPNWMLALKRWAVALTLGFGLSAIYLLPALSYIHFANVNFQWFLVQLVRPHPYIADLNSSVNKLYALYAVMALIFAFLYYRRSSGQRSQSFFLVAGFIAAFMMTPLSKFVWDALPLISIIQMCERFSTVLALCLAFLAAAAMPKMRIVNTLLLSVYAIVLVVVAMHTRTTPEQFQKTDPNRYHAYLLNIEQYASYLPGRDLFNRYGTPEGVSDVMQHREEVRVLSGDAEVKVLQWKPRDILIETHIKSPSTLLVRQFDFPGWVAFIDDKELDVVRNAQTGEIQFDVPAGSNHVHLMLTALLPEVIAKMISLFSAAVVLLAVLYQARSRQKNNA